MSSREDLHELLCDCLGGILGYFQPPATVKMRYPCFVYSLDDIDTKYADDMVYHHKKKYKITVIDNDPDSVIHENLLSLPYCSFDRPYTANNLNHWVYTFYY